MADRVRDAFSVEIRVQILDFDFFLDQQGAGQSAWDEDGVHQLQLYSAIG